MTGTLLMDSSLLANAETVVARARTGDPEALAALYRAFEVPVYNLALLLGLPRDDDERWLALCSVEDQPIALAFAELEGHAEVAPGDFFSAAPGSSFFSLMTSGCAISATTGSGSASTFGAAT